MKTYIKTTLRAIGLIVVCWVWAYLMFVLVPVLLTSGGLQSLLGFALTALCVTPVLIHIKAKLKE